MNQHLESFLPESKYLINVNNSTDLSFTWNGTQKFLLGITACAIYYIPTGNIYQKNSFTEKYMKGVEGASYSPFNMVSFQDWKYNFLPGMN